MTTRDGIGAPRKRDVVDRDRTALELIRQRSADGQCTRLSDLKKVLDPSLSRSQVFYVFKRLQAAGLIERRAGYLWCIADEG
jgi:DNA-binding Lrp family transcriptional regulator